MLRRILLFLACAAAAFAATSRLYLKDGTYQMVREYQVQDDRIKYYSTERSEWEEIPTELVDLDRTKKEIGDREDTLKVEIKEQEQEDAAIKAEREEIRSIPEDPGAYYIHSGKLEPIKAAELKVVNSKKRTVLKVLSPIPLVPGKSTVEIDGETSTFRITEDRPNFYFRLTAEEGFALIKIERKKGLRIVETVDIMPVTNEMQEQRKVIATFKRQLGERLFKIWPEQPLEPGEYALIQFLPGEMHEQVWDFGLGPAK